LAADISQVQSKLKSARRILSQGGAKKGNWLSKIRNEISYRHDHGVWWPHSAKNNIEKCTSIIRSYLAEDPLKNDLEEAQSIEAFLKVCLFVVNLTRTTILDMSQLDPGQSFHETGSMIILRRGNLIK
jgi:hypothetical protein